MASPFKNPAKIDSTRFVTIVFEGRFNGIGYNEMEINDSVKKSLKVFRGRMFGLKTRQLYNICEDLLDKDSMLNEVHLYRRHRLLGQLEVLQSIPKRMDANQQYLIIKKVQGFRSRMPFEFQWMTYDAYLKHLENN